jgi:hypothetical protein
MLRFINLPNKAALQVANSSSYAVKGNMDLGGKIPTRIKGKGWGW